MKTRFIIISATLVFGAILSWVFLQNCATPIANSSNLEWKKKYDFNQTREKFAEPPLFYAPHTFWFWDTNLDPSQTASMAQEMTKQRLNPG